ncbi:hypothetical protein [Pseudomonas cremoricolorata]|uniref:hypothetical protein n=1 Tax=Pseudomonas cremoricolorata TaxID=157783 RepID=UPI00048C9DE6|nr:hypothetical protein [Pseudomonas cremoricolorata]
MQRSEAMASDSIMKASEYMRLGCGNARAARSVLLGERFAPVSAIAAKRVGTRILIDFHVPCPPLVLDTVTVIDPGHHGFRYDDSTHSARVTAVRLTGPAQVELTLDAVLTGTDGFVGIADVGEAGQWGGPATGMRTNLRDSCPDLDSQPMPVRLGLSPADWCSG